MSKSNLNEYIKRSEAIEALEDDYNLCFAMDPTIPQDSAYYKVKRAAVRVIARVHPADVKPVVRGEWIYDSPHGVPHCSNCGEVSVESVFGRSEPNFCPNCGADMRGECNVD